MLLVALHVKTENKFVLRSKNANIRETSARLLDHVVDSIGPAPLITAYNLREMRKLILESAVLFLDDQNAKVRYGRSYFYIAFIQMFLNKYF